ncbi:T9SS type A sorting domain-containing protein [Chitinophagaceae bacterium MMS25-I14]
MRLSRLLLIAILLLPFCSIAQISITGTLPFTYTQNFNSFAGTAASVPTGWTTTVSNNNYRGTGTGTSNTGGIWAYGSGSDYSMGGLASNTSSAITFTVTFVNNSATTLNSLNISYDFKQWRWAAGNTNPLTATQSGIGTSVAGLTQNSTASGGTNGIAAVTPKSISLTGLSIAAGATFSITWTITDGVGSDNAMAIDNFSLTADGAGSPCVTPAAPTAFQYTIANPTQTNVSFTAPAGGASGYIAVATTIPPLTASPANGTAYNVTSTIGGGTVIYKGTATSFSATGLNPLLDYYYYIFAYNDNCTGGPVYSTSLNGVDSLPAPVVTADPIDSTVCNGNAASFSVAAINGITYQWQEYTTAWNNLSNTGVYSGANTNTLNISNVNSLAGNQYRCIVTGSLAHTDTSGAATLHLRPATVITQQPSNTAVCLQQPAHFITHATGYNISWQWQEDQGTGFINLSNTAPYHGVNTDSLYIDTTTALMNHYRYRCILLNGCGISDTTMTDSLTIYANPTAQITTTSPLSFCQNDSVILHAPAVPGYSYQWIYGSTTVNGSNSYTAYNSGSYTVTITDSNQCSSTSTPDSVTVFSLPSATVSPSGSASICQGSSITLNANTGTGLHYQWNENGSNITGATTAMYTAANNSTYTVIITDSNSCKNAASVTVSVLPFPVASATPAGSTTVCQGGQVDINANAATGLTYQWLYNNSIINNAAASLYSASTSGLYSVIVSNGAGCSDTSAGINVTVLPLPFVTASAAGLTTFCAGDSVRLHATANAGTTLQWTVGGNGISYATDSLFTAKISGSYTVTATNAAGCSSTSPAINVTVNPVPNTYITYFGSLSFCQDGAVVLTGSTPTGLAYQWMKDGNPIPNAITYSYIVAQQGTYTLYETNGYGCSRLSNPVGVTVFPKPQPAINKNGYTLSTGTYSSYQWFFNGNPIPGAVAQTYTAIQDGGYFVEVTDNNGCVNRSTLLFVNNVGIVSPANISEAIQIYPNPANDIIHINAPFTTSIVIRDQQGKILLEKENAQAADISAFAEGIYFITVVDNNHNPVTTRKLVKTR